MTKYCILAPEWEIRGCCFKMRLKHKYASPCPRKSTFKTLTETGLLLLLLKMHDQAFDSGAFVRMLVC